MLTVGVLPMVFASLANGVGDMEVGVADVGDGDVGSIDVGM